MKTANRQDTASGSPTEKLSVPRVAETPSRVMQMISRMMTILNSFLIFS